MDIAVMAGAVTAIVEMVKKWAFLSKVSPIILSVVASVGVVIYYALQSGTVINLALLWVLVQVIAYANGIFKLLKVASGTPSA